jgi:acyl transferase domain-containing protein
MSDSEIDDPLGGSDVAVIGMAGRFPGADTIDQFWRNLEEGVESIRRFSAEELDHSGFGRRSSPGSEHIPAGAVLDDIELFDADFFGFTPKEAEVMDPQHRIFLEMAWTALESAGYAAGEGAGTVAVYAGSLLSTYLLNVYSNPDILNSVGMAQIGIGNHVDFLPTMLSYKLGLSGPSLAIQTACSTSLVATHVACQALLNGECDLALAGGVAVRTPQRSGYQYQQGGILSPDGRCRAFDAEAEGTVFGNGGGIVVLKRLADALADGDTVRAIIKGSAINNDGALKVGFTAPSVQGQSSVIVEALAAAGVSADTIGYVEAHGTGTTLGDPIEVQALTEAFRVTTQQRGYCPIGSVKTNVGHLDAAAGVTGLIKVILALEHQAIPPSLNCVKPNPRIDFESSPFFVNTELRRWERSMAPRRAGVSSLGIGGTNAHLVVEEAPAQPAPEPAGDHQLLILSGKTERALDLATRQLADHLRRHPEANLADVAYTLQLGRKAFDVRRALVCDSVAAAVAGLESDDRKRLSTGRPTGRPPSVAFMFSGQGSQHAGMAADLYRSEPFFRDEVDRCAVLLRDELLSDDILC